MKNRNKIIALGAMIATLLLIFLLILNDINSSEGSSKSQSSSSEESVSYSSSDDESVNSSNSDEDTSQSNDELESSSSTSDDNDKDPGSYKTGVTYDQIARTPDEFESKKLQFTGKVIQVIEDDDDTQVRLAVDGNYKNVILVDITKDLLNNSRVLEDDLLTVSGTSQGTTSYKSTVSGKITIPAMNAKIINDQGKASDDYGE